MSTLPASPHPLAVVAFFRTRVRLYVALTLGVAFLMGLATRPQSRVSLVEGHDVYVSHASLLLVGDTRFVMNEILASTGQNELDFWLSDTPLFTKFLERQKVYEKSGAKLRSKYPNLAALSGSVNMGTSQDNSQLEVVITTKGGMADLFSSAPVARESGYAQLERNDDRWRLKQQRTNRIVIEAMAETPEDSEALARVVATVLQKELGDFATRRARAQRLGIERYIRVSSKKVARAQRALQVASASEPERVLLRQHQKQEAENNCRDLTREIADLSRQIELKRNDSAFRAATLANPAQQAVEALQQQLRLGERTYLPNSATLTRLRDKLPNLENLAQRMDAENAEKEMASLRASLLARQRLLQHGQAERRKFGGTQPSSREQQEFKLRERELATWEAELLSWEQKLLQARIEERLCQGDGTAILLQVPRPGTRSSAVVEDFLDRYHRTLSMLPLAPLASLVCLLLISLFEEARQIRTRAEYFFDAPVLGELPSLQRAHRQAWQYRKFEGRTG